MSVVEESLSAALDFLLATDGTLIGQARALGDVDVTTQLGKPLSETYWFRHSDTDERELTNLIRDASNGKAERLRVWVRVSEHQLVRCDLLVTPITGPGGEVTHISARTEPTPSTPRRRGPVEPIVKAISTQASPSNPTDLLQLRLSIPMMRVELSTLTVLQANDALLELFELPLEVFPKPLVDFIDSSERASVLDALNQFRSTQIDRTIDTRLIRKHLTFEAGLSISIDPIDAEANSVLITIKDRSAERIATDLVQRAEQLAAQSARQDSTLRTLERLINACPIPIGVIEDGKISHASQSLRDRFDHEALSSLIANKRSTPRSDVISLDEQGHIFGVIATTPVALNAIDPSTLLAIATIDLHGRIHHWNATFARWAGATETQAPRGLFDALDTESRLALEVSLRKFENEPQTITLRFERTGVVSRCEIFQSGNTFVLLALDQSDVQNHLDEIERALASERRLLDALPMRLIRVDSNGKLVWSNRAGAAGDLPDLETALANNGSTENQTLPNGVELQPIERSSSTTAFALIDRRDERDTRRRVSRFDALESLINNDPPLALLELDLQTGVTTANNSARDLLKLAADVPIVLTELCMPVDRIAVERAFYGGGHTEKDRIDFEFHLDSTGQKLRAVGQVFFDHDNGTAVPIGAIARLVDTERERIPSVERNPITTALFESIEGAVRIYMPDTVRQNGAAIRLFGIDEVNWRDVDAWHARHNPRDAQGNSIAPNALPAQAAIRGESLNLEMVIDTPHGARFVRSSVTPIFIDQQVVGCVCIDIDQTDESDQRQKLESLETRLNEQIDATRAASAETARIVDQLGTVRAEWIAQLPAPIVQLDLDGRLQHANASALRLLGIESGTEWLFQNFEWFDAQDRPISADDLLALFRRVEPNSIPLHAKDPRRSHMLWLELQSAQSADGITLLLRDRSREVSAMASLSQLQTRINEISSEAESRRLRMLGDHHALVTLIQIMCADVDSVAQPLALDRRLPNDAHSLARGAADVVSLAHRILEAAVDRPRAIELSVGVRRRSDLLQLAREAIHLIGPLTTRLAREVLLSADTNEALVDVEPALARHSIVAALLSAIGNTPARAKIELKLETIDEQVQIEVVCASAGSMKKTGLMQHFADALAKSAGAMLDPNTASSCWSARFQLLTDTTSVRPISTRARCVLLIEDHESTARVISRQLARVGCVVRTVRGAGEARLALRESSDIDLILCDMSLPDGDPLELMSDLTKQYGLRGVALGAGSDNDMQSIRDSGFVERLAKPVDLVLLANVINRVVAMPRGEVESSR